MQSDLVAQVKSEDVAYNCQSHLSLRQLLTSTVVLVSLNDCAESESLAMLSLIVWMIVEKQTETEHPLDKTDLQCEYNKPLPISVPMTEPLRGRKCTDVPCLLIFIFFNACMWALAGWSYQEGDPQRLIQGWDLHANFCGTGELADWRFTYFLTPLESINPTVCVPGCPAVKARGAVSLYDEFLQEEDRFGKYEAVPSRPFYNNYCLPADREMRAAVLSWLYSQDQVMTRVVGDLARAWDELAIAGLVSFGALLVYFFAFKFRCK